MLWVPLVAGLLMRATRPLLWFCGGTSPMPPGRGLRPLHPQFPTPVGLGFAGVLGPTRGRVGRGWLLASFYGFVGGHPPRPPARGLRPLDPRLPTPVGLGFAGVLGPTRGGVANVGYSPPFMVLWGHIPHAPWEGAAPLHPQFPTPVG